MLTLFCANVKPPPGGPVDKTPPEIIYTIPESGSVQVDPEIKIEARFNEGINPKSVENSVFITPYPGDNVRIKSGGKKITIQFPQALKFNQTYVVTFGTGIKDYRGNALAASQTLAFSTGSTLDEGEIKGRVFGYKDATGVGVWAYGLSDTSNPDPTVREPDYIVQCDASGAYHFSYLSPGKYRLFAVRDRLADRLYQRGEDEIGITSDDPFVSVDQLLSGPFVFRMTKEDTLGPVLARVIQKHQRHITLQFSEPVIPPPENLNAVVSCTAVSDSLDSLKIEYRYLDSESNRLYHLITEPQENKKLYRIRVSAFTDTSGNAIQAAHCTAEFEGSMKVDTTAPKILLVDPKQNQDRVNLDTYFQLILDEPVDSLQFREHLLWTDTLGQTVAYRFHWINLAHVRLVPEEKLLSKTVYRITVDFNGIFDSAGNAAGDTSFTFKTINADTLSEISGMVMDFEKSAEGSLYLRIYQIEDHMIHYETLMPSPGPYRFSQILPGNYFLQCYRDEDRNGSYSTGRVAPFQHSERFYVYPDTIAVRSRWPNEGNDLIMP